MSINFLLNYSQKLLIYFVFLPVLANAQLIDAQDAGYIYNGKKYSHPAKIPGSTPYFKDIGFIKDGLVVFDDVVYKNIPLVYDISSDALVVQQSGTNTAIIAVKEFVDYFVIHRDTIDRIKYDDAGLKSGYHERIYVSSGIRCYAEHSKSLWERSGEKSMIKIYKESVNYFLKMPGDEVFSKFKTYKEFLNLHKKRKREIKKATSVSKSDFNENPKSVIAGVLQYIDQHPLP